VEVDVTRLVGAGRSSSIAALYCAMRAAHTTHAMHLRIRDDRVWVHPRLRLSTTVLRPDETFGFAVFDPIENFDDFRSHAEAEIERARRVANAMSAGDSVPRIVFGRRSQDGARWRMPLAVEVHHAVMDGLDVHRFVESFQQQVDAGVP
jgi:chloramphenicol O-acetyltransferase type A